MLIMNNIILLDVIKIYWDLNGQNPWINDTVVDLKCVIRAINTERGTKNKKNKLVD